MGTLVKLMFFLTFVGIALGCEKEKDLFVGEDTAGLKAVKIKVQPSTETDVLAKAEEDWQNINDALHNAKPGETVQLASGTFYLHKSIVCWNFSGTLKGAGKEKTIIRTRTAQDKSFDISDCPAVNWSFENNSGAFMLCFAHGYFKNERTVSVSNLSIIVDVPTPDRPKGKTGINSMHAIMVMYTGLDNDRENPVDLNVSYKNLSVNGEYDEKYFYEGYSLFSALSGYGYSNGTFEVKNVSVKNASGCIKPHAFMGEDARVIIKNSQLSSCVRGVYSFFCHSWTIQDNQIKNCKNAITPLGQGPGEPWEGPNGSSYIKDNRICFEGGVGIGMQHIKNVDVKNNNIEGSGIGIATNGGENIDIKDNDLCGVSPTPIFIGSLINSEIKNNSNQIILGPGASHPSIIIGDGIDCDD